MKNRTLTSMRGPVRRIVAAVLFLLGTATVAYAAGAQGVEHAPAAAHGAGGDSALSLIASLFVFMLATFIGFDVIRNVSRLLHTPLMSLTNAISAIAVVGAILVAGPEWGADHPLYINILGLVAVVCSVTNIVSGFLITDRMLKMFKPREVKKS
jgi:NAD(P) transhydrogenase subunit alpha